MTGSPHFALACTFGWMFLVSGGLKLRAPQKLALHLMSLRALSPAACRALAVLVPLGEIGVGVLLLTGLFGLAAAAANLALLVVFTGYVAWILGTGRRASCFCFGEDEEPTTKATLQRNLVLLAAAILLLVGEFMSSAPLGTAARVLGLVHGVTGLCLFLSVTQLLALRRQQVVPQ